MRELWREQCLALAMAKHPRLGHDSCAAHLPPDCLATIAQTCKAAHAALLRSPYLREIRAKQSGALDGDGTRIDRIEFVRSDDVRYVHGGLGGSWQEPFLLQRGEFCVRICGTRCSARGSSTGLPEGICSLSLFTSRGRSVTYGSPDADATSFSYVAPCGRAICDIVCREARIWPSMSWLHRIEGVRSEATPWISDVGRVLAAFDELSVTCLSRRGG